MGGFTGGRVLYFVLAAERAVCQIRSGKRFDQTYGGVFGNASSVRRAVYIYYDFEFYVYRRFDAFC